MKFVAVVFALAAAVASAAAPDEVVEDSLVGVPLKMEMVELSDVRIFLP
jgi:hypothetical protein